MGNAVTEQTALLAPPELIGIHTNMAATVPANIAKARQFGDPPPSSLSADEKGAREQLDFFYKHGLGYAQEMMNRPQRLYALADSPIGLAAWMLDHDARSYALIARVFDGPTEGRTRDDVLDNITLYWFTNTAVSSARLYWESKLAFFAPKGVAVPTAVSVFPDETYAARGVGQRKRIPNSFITTGSPKAVTSRRGNSNAALAIAAAEVGMIAFPDAQSNKQPSGLGGEQKMSQLSQMRSSCSTPSSQPSKLWSATER